jgi:hypothetical protein
MILHLNWSRAIPLKDGTKHGLIYTVDLGKVPNRPGIYIFGRLFGNTFEALYVGKATRIRGRIHSHFNNLRLMQHLREAKIGKRVLLAGVLQMKPGQKLPKCLTLSERALIRHFLSEGHDLVNKLGTQIRRHELISDGAHPKRYFPRTVYTERAKGE